MMMLCDWQSAFVFEPLPRQPRASQLLKIDTEYLMLNCSVVECADLAVWLPSVEGVAPEERYYAIVISAFRSKDACGGSVIIGPTVSASLPGLAAGLGVGLSTRLGVASGSGPESSSGESFDLNRIRAVNRAVQDAQGNPASILALLQPYLHVTNAAEGLLELQVYADLDASATTTIASL